MHGLASDPSALMRRPAPLCATILMLLTLPVRLQKIYKNTASAEQCEGCNEKRPPMMMYSGGCDGSTWALHTVRDLMDRHGLRVQPFNYELLKPEKNRYHKGGMKMSDAMRALYAEARHHNSLFVFKGDTGSNHLRSVQAALHKMDTLAVVLWRANVLDQLVCTIRDSFIGAPGHAINVATGKWHVKERCMIVCHQSPRFTCTCALMCYE